MRSIVTNLTGSAPVCSTSARFFASVSEPMPVISAPPFDGSIPSGYFWYSICGHERSWLSSTIAKCCGVPSVWPRIASSRVISWKILLPWLLNCIVTIGAPLDGSKSCCVPFSFRSLPVICGTGFGESRSCLKR